MRPENSPLPQEPKKESPLPKAPQFNKEKSEEMSPQNTSPIKIPKFGEPGWKPLYAETDYDLLAARLKELEPKSTEEEIQEVVKAKQALDKHSAFLDDAEESLRKIQNIITSKTPAKDSDNIT